MMPESVTNTCVFCNRECSFLATCDGCCLNCGDAMQLGMKSGPEVIFAFVESVRARKDAEAKCAKLAKENERLRNELKALNSFAISACEAIAGAMTQ